jgi:hypothetical protein
MDENRRKYYPDHRPHDRHRTGSEVIVCTMSEKNLASRRGHGQAYKNKGRLTC